MLPLDDKMRAKLGLELSTLRQDHGDMNAAIHALTHTPSFDRMMLGRLKRKKLVLKDRIVALEKILLPDIIA